MKRSIVTLSRRLPTYLSIEEDTGDMKSNSNKKASYNN
jgi:hypothetical protein